MLLLAASPSRWFEQVRFPGYSEATGLSDGQAWRKRDLVDKPFRFHEVSQLLDLWSHLKLPPEAEVKSVAQQTVAGTPALCVESGPTTALWHRDTASRAAVPAVARWNNSRATLCFDADSGALLSAAYGKDMPRFEYEGQVTLGTKAYPRTLRCFEGKELAIEATVVELAEVGSDGLIHDLAFIQLRGGLYGGVREAAKQWRYALATCNGVPVPAHIHIAYTYLP